MSELLSVTGYRVSESAAPFSVRVDKGAWIGVVAPAEVDASRFLAAFVRRSSTGLVEPSALGSKKSVQQLAKGADAEVTTRILTSLRLWDVRKMALGALTDAQRRCAAFIPALAGGSNLILAADWLDSLDPWALKGLLELLRESQAAKVIVSSRPDILAAVDRLIVLNSRGLRFDGAPSDLVKIIRPATVEVETEDPGAVAAIIEPLDLQIESGPGRLVVRTHEGQELAAKLALHGYPWIRAITVRTPTLEEALQSLIR